MEKLLGIIELGSPLEDAAAFCDVDKATVYRWQMLGREAARGQYREFYEGIEKAKAKRRINYRTTLITHGKRQWKAAAWLAERTDPAEFQLSVRVHVTNEIEKLYRKVKAHRPDIYEGLLEAASTPDGGEETFSGAAEGAAAFAAGLAAGVGPEADSALSVSASPHSPDGED